MHIYHDLVNLVASSAFRDIVARSLKRCLNMDGRIVGVESNAGRTEIVHNIEAESLLTKEV